MAKIQKHYLRTLIDFATAAGTLGVTFRDKVFLFLMLIRWRAVEHARALGRFWPVPSVLSIRFRDQILHLSVLSDLTFAAVFFEIFIREDYRLALDQSPRHVIDLGAQFGLASLYFSCVYPTAQIFAFEPSSNNFRLLQKNVAARSNILAVNKGIYSKNGFLDLFLDDYGGGNNSLLVKTQHSESIECLRLDDFLAERGHPHIDLLKIDVEGAEEEIFRSSECLADIDYVVGELHFDVIDKDETLKRLQDIFVLKLDYIHPLCPVFFGKNKKLNYATV